MPVQRILPPFRSALRPLVDGETRTSGLEMNDVVLTRPPAKRHVRSLRHLLRSTDKGG